ncbi:hypothetical protein [Acinetobacter phage P1068]|uniref:Uncharacterized protein n=1 Tax=Acinetobacter phage P919 TaxID=3229763 RepID=A0AB39AIS2_9CAUD|nr:hypothetical protein [Acinetobacter phage P1068]
MALAVNTIGCTAHSIKNNIHVVVCVQCVN